MNIHVARTPLFRTATKHTCCQGQSSGWLSDLMWQDVAIQLGEYFESILVKPCSDTSIYFAIISIPNDQMIKIGLHTTLSSLNQTIIIKYWSTYILWESYLFECSRNTYSSMHVSLILIINLYFEIYFCIFIFMYLDIYSYTVYTTCL